MEFILASASPRRRELLKKILPEFRVVTAPVDERAVSLTDPEKLCEALASLKCSAVFRSHPDCCVIGSDTMVAADGRLLGKPADYEEEMEMLRLLSGREHDVFTGVCIRAPGVEESFVCRSRVRFRTLSEREMDAYARTEEPYDKAGGYGIQGTASRFCDSISGDYFNIMGLPVCELYVRLVRLGLLEL